MARLEAYVALLETWNRRINLVGPRTLDDVWRRHILDSLQLERLIPETARVLIDLGSGAGFPGLILAISRGIECHLVESDMRKCAFLREAARVTGAAITVHAQRIESMPRVTADVITARALAPVWKLLELAEPFLAPHSILLFPKGRAVAEELTEARKEWKMHEMQHASVSDPSGTILQLTKVTRAG
jgi:16S rRNA (guanine527-N7)-methyltransferase